MKQYALTEGTTIIRLADGTSISADEANNDYIEYLDWVAAGNLPDPYIVSDKTPEQLIAKDPDMPTLEERINTLEQGTTEQKDTMKLRVKNIRMKHGGL